MSVRAARGASVRTSMAVRSERWCPRFLRKSDIGPKATRWNIQSMYTAPKTMTRAAMAAASGLTAKVPTKTRNSPTKPARPGRPTLASMKKPKIAA